MLYCISNKNALHIFASVTAGQTRLLKVVKKMSISIPITMYLLCTIGAFIKARFQSKIAPCKKK